MESWLFRPLSITAFSQTGHIATLVFGFLAFRDAIALIQRLRQLSLIATYA